MSKEVDASPGSEQNVGIFPSTVLPIASSIHIQSNGSTFPTTILLHRMNAVDLNNLTPEFPSPRDKSARLHTLPSLYLPDAPQQQRSLPHQPNRQPIAPLPPPSRTPILGMDWRASQSANHSPTTAGRCRSQPQTISSNTANVEALHIALGLGGKAQQQSGS